MPSTKETRDRKVLSNANKTSQEIIKENYLERIKTKNVKFNIFYTNISEPAKKSEKVNQTNCILDYLGKNYDIIVLEEVLHDSLFTNGQLKNDIKNKIINNYGMFCSPIKGSNKKETLNTDYLFLVVFWKLNILKLRVDVLENFYKKCLNKTFKSSTISESESRFFSSTPKKEYSIDMSKIKFWNNDNTFIVKNSEVITGVDICSMLTHVQPVLFDVIGYNDQLAVFNINMINNYNSKEYINELSNIKKEYTSFLGSSNPNIVILGTFNADNTMLAEVTKTININFTRVDNPDIQAVNSIVKATNITHPQSNKILALLSENFVIEKKQSGSAEYLQSCFDNKAFVITPILYNLTPNQSGGYYEKYLKYKQKYLQLKQQSNF